MNNSGDAVRAIVDWYKINLDQLFIIVDDKDHPWKNRFRKRELRWNMHESIIEKLNSKF